MRCAMFASLLRGTDPYRMYFGSDWSVQRHTHQRPVKSLVTKMTLHHCVSMSRELAVETCVPVAPLHISIDKPRLLTCSPCNLAGISPHNIWKFGWGKPPGLQTPPVRQQVRGFGQQPVAAYGRKDNTFRQCLLPPHTPALNFATYCHTQNT